MNFESRKYEQKWMPRWLEVNYFCDSRIFWDASNFEIQLHDPFQSGNQRSRSNFFPLGPRGVGPRFALFFYLLRCRLLSCCIVWLTASWHALLLAASCHNVASRGCNLADFWTCTLFVWGFLWVLIGKCLCVLCFQVVDLPVLIGECFAPHLPFCFGKGSATSSCW